MSFAVLIFQVASTLILVDGKPLVFASGRPGAWEHPQVELPTDGLTAVPIPPIDATHLPIYGTLAERGFGDSGWLDRGEADGVRAGESWWLRVQGQPAAVFEVQTVFPQRCFGRIVPLAEGLRIIPGMRFQRWHQPLDRDANALGRNGNPLRLLPIETAVTAVESEDNLVWIALPEDSPVRARVVFPASQGRGVLEARAGGFGKVRLSPATRAASLGPGTAGIVLPPGDAELVEQLVLVGRVFDAGAESAYVDVGRLDLLEREMVGWLPSGAQVQVRRIWDTYAQIRGVGLQDGALVALGRDPVLARAELAKAGHQPVQVSGVFDRVGFVCQAAPDWVVGRTAMLSDGKQVLAVGVICAVLDGRAIGWIDARTALRKPAEGDLVHVNVAHQDGS